MSASWSRTWRRGILILLFVVSAVETEVNAQLLYSFETGSDGWVLQGGADSDYIAHAPSTTGATHGAMALEIETGSGFGRDVVVNETVLLGGPMYDLFNTVSADPSLYTFDFDVTFTSDSWSSLMDTGDFFQIDVFSNSDSLQGFEESFGVANGNPGFTSSFTASLPASQLSLTPNSAFYQVGFGSNSNHTNGAGGEGVLYYIDNIRFSPALSFHEELLFSWETPDDLGTPAIDERLEGWGDGFVGQPYQHTRTITPDGATDGSWALEVDSSQSGFAWGSQFVLDSVADPAEQSSIDSLIASFNTANKIAFDVTFPDDLFPDVPTFLSLFLNVSDASGTFYQSPPKQAGNPVAQAGETITVEIPLSEMVAGGMNLADAGLVDGTFFRIALATNSDDANFFSIDNLRLVTALTGLGGDYNNDGSVDAADYTLWRDNVGAVAGTLLNDTDGGVIGPGQYTTWASNFGATASTATPEPTCIVTLMVGLALLRVRRKNPSLANC